ncbi:hypothetical protein [Paenibacillus sinensis]|uniref:hypothetical protein n=1 Tax=Paenibacillus sinensis TaxID=2834413 RepID=UPI001F2D3DDB|nr:hypothetical protein [Paenibacillus sinensis]
MEAAMHRVYLNPERFSQQVIDHAVLYAEFREYPECVRLQFIGDGNNAMTVAMALELQDSKAQVFAVTSVSPQRT